MNLKNLKNCSEILWCCLASLETEPEQTIEKYGCTYVLKEGETE